jgi:hypothetical protein
MFYVADITNDWRLKHWPERAAARFPLRCKSPILKRLDVMTLNSYDAY